MGRTKKWLAILALLPLLGAGQQNMGPGRHRTAAASLTYTDNFPGSSLSGNWTCYAGSGYLVPTVGTNQVYENQVTGGYSLCGYTAGTFTTNQRAQFLVGSLSSNGYQGAAPCVNVNPTLGTGYCASAFNRVGNLNIQIYTAGVPTSISSGCGATPSVGDTLWFSNNGSGNLTFYDVTTSTTLCTATDTTYTGGYAGFTISDNGGSIHTTLASAVLTP